VYRDRTMNWSVESASSSQYPWLWGGYWQNRETWRCKAWSQVTGSADNVAWRKMYILYIYKKVIQFYAATVYKIEW